MIVDCHTHINCASDEVEMSEHIAAAETVGACIVLATADGPSEEVNKRLSKYVNKHKEKMVGFAVIELIKDKISVNNLKAIKDKLGLKGVVLYCSVLGLHPAHSRAMRFYESAEELGLPVFFHNDDTLEADAVRLLISGLQRAQAGYKPAPGELPYMLQVCRQVQGMPLGILLAASWGATFSMDEIAESVSRIATNLTVIIL